MEDDLKNGRRPQKWKMTSKMEDDLKNARLLLLVVVKNDPPQSPHLSKMTPLNLLTSQNDPHQSHVPKMTPLNLLTFQK